jgi:glycosyltransferase involved in cell wall biosynthesis
MIRQVRHVDRFVAVSEYCAAYMSDLLQIPPHRIAVVPLGIGMAGYEQRPTGATADFCVGYFARIAPEKGLHVLADAYVQLRRRMGKAPARLVAAGYIAPAQASYLRDVGLILEKAGLEDEFMYRGAVDRDGKLAREPMLSVPATYDEPKACFLEAMAAVCQSCSCVRAASSNRREASGGLLVEPDNPAPRDGLTPCGPIRLADGLQVPGVRRGSRHYTIAQSADRLLALYHRAEQEPSLNAVVAQRPC